jgi:outer membrane protein assembly factor BamB
MPVRTVVTLVGVMCLMPVARADDWPQWLGPERDGVWRDACLPDALMDDTVTVRWRTPVGGGYAGPAVAAGRVFVTDFTPRDPAGDGKAGRERVLCLDESTGAVLWSHAYDVAYTFDYRSGPRTTPVVDGDRVYTLGGEGHLLCLDVKSGKPVWSKRFADDQAETPMWGFAAHPLIVGDKLICLTGPAPAGKLVTAFDKRTGDPLWTALKGKEIGYCPPTMIQSGGTRQLIIFHPESVNSLDPETGKVHWTVPFGPVRYGVSITTPRLARHPTLGDLLVVSSYWDGTMVLRLAPDAPRAEVLWTRAGRGRTQAGTLHNLMAPPLVTGTHLYGVSRGGQLRCLDLATGDVAWETYAATTGDEGPVDNATAFLVPAPTPDKTLLFNDRGDVILARLSPAGYQELGRKRLLEPTGSALRRPVLWCHPALANGSVYWRNDREIVRAALGRSGE